MRSDNNGASIPVSGTKSAVINLSPDSHHREAVGCDRRCSRVKSHIFSAVRVPRLLRGYTGNSLYFSWRYYYILYYVTTYLSIIIILKLPS